MDLRARRTEVRSLPDGLTTALADAAARVGTLHESDDLVLCAFGVAAQIGLPRGLHDPAAPGHVAATLGSIELSGDPGPGGSGVVAMGALPFDGSAQASLSIPRLLCTWSRASATLWITQIADGAIDADPLRNAISAATITDVGAPPRITTLRERVPSVGYEDAVARCVRELATGTMTKVVLARSVEGHCDAPVDTAALASALRASEPTCMLYAYPSGARRYVGSSPELLVATGDGAVWARPLAGTIGLQGDDSNERQVAWLAASEKNHVEHDAVVKDIVERLGPLCDVLTAQDEPVIVELTSVAHLATWIDGKLRGPTSALSAIQVLAALHPTPAVGGVPRDQALAMIADLEGIDRGVWAGPVGWVDADGTSLWTLAIRGVLVDGAAIEVWAGAGIVADSVPHEELLETDVKMNSVLRVFAR